MLIVPFYDARVDRHVGQRFAGGAALDQKLQLVPGVEALDLPRRVAVGVIPDPVLETVGVENDRPTPCHLLQAVRVQLGLLLADLRALGRPFGLHDRQRETVCPPQDVVDEALAVAIGHAGDWVLAVLGVCKGPASFGEHDVDEPISSVGLVVVPVVGLLVSGLNLLDSLTQSRDLGVLLCGQLVLLRQRLGMGFILSGEPRGELGDFLPRERCGLSGDLRIERGLHRHSLRVGRIPECCPHDHVVQFAQRVQRRPRWDRLRIMDSGVAKLADQVQLGRDPHADLRLELRVVDLRRKVILVRKR